MENRVDGAELTRESEGDGVGTRFPYNIKWAQVLFRKFLGWPPSSKELHLDISLVADLLHRSWVRGSDSAAQAMSVVMAPWSRSSDTVCTTSPDMPEHIARCGSSSCSGVRTGCPLQSTAESSE